MKKKVLIWSFSLLILSTAIFFIVSAINSYNYDLATSEDGLFVGFVAFVIMVFGGFLVLYELDLFYTVYYFLIKPKTPLKTVLNICSNLALVFVFVYAYLAEFFMELRKYEATPLILSLLYVVLRIAYFSVCVISSKKEMKE
jgi:hypothetical protein